MTNLPARAFPPDAAEKLKGKVCEACDGKGKRLRSDGHRMEAEDCNTCQGTGRVYGECVTVEAMKQPPEGWFFQEVWEDLASFVSTRIPSKDEAVGVTHCTLPYRVGDVVAVAEEWRGNSLYRPGTQDFTISTIAQRLGVSVADVKSVIDFDEPWQPADTMPPELADQCGRARCVGVSVKQMTDVTHEEWEAAGYKDEYLSGHPGKWAVCQYAAERGLLSEGRFTENPYVALVTWRGESAK